MSRLKHTLDQWQSWGLPLVSPPRPIRKIRGGFTNCLYVISDGYHQFVLRLNHPYSHDLGISRARESTIVTQLSAYGIAPHLHFTCEHFNYAVFEFVEGKTCSSSDLYHAPTRSACRQLVRRYSALAIDCDDFDYLGYFERYWRKANRAQPSVAAQKRNEFSEFMRRLSAYQRSRPPRCLVHHDVHAGNLILGPQGYTLVDWEYAGRGFQGLDQMALNRYCRIKTTRYTRQQKLLAELRAWADTLWWLIRSGYH